MYCKSDMRIVGGLPEEQSEEIIHKSHFTLSCLYGSILISTLHWIEERFTQ